VVRLGAAHFWGDLTLALAPGEIISAFRERFHNDAKPELYRAPGRVNLIGEHTDYNLGYVFPIALEMACYVAAAPASHGKLRVYSRDRHDEFSVDPNRIADARPLRKWSDYVMGVAQKLQAVGIKIPSADLYLETEVPAGSGLSSSAALEIATAYALLGKQKMAPLDIARVGQRAEVEFVGMPCGIMDQYASVFGRKDAAIRIDCRSTTHEYVSLPQDVKIIAVNSMVKHELGTSAYRERVAECREAVAAIREIDPHVESLRDVSLPFFEEVQNSVPALARRRARHVISDSQRVLDLSDAAEKHDLSEMGRLFVASHRSMQYDYEISCEEIDFLVDTAIKIPGVYGSRMTGGGFGGCTVNLVAPEAVGLFREKISEAYQKRYEIVPAFYDCKPAEGAGPVAH